MKDGATKACVGMVCVAAIYVGYMVSNAVAGQPIPNGTILTAVVGVVCGLAGYSIATKKAENV